MTLLYFTINDTITRKALSAISSTAHNPDKRTYPVVVGGIAIQLHCRDMKDNIRPTSDLDLMYLPSIIDFNHFSRGIGGEISEELKTAGYQIQLKKIKHRPLYEVRIMNGQGNKAKELYFIHFDKLVPELEVRTSHVSEREVANSVQMNLGDYSPIMVKRVEDILPHKLKRIRKIMTDKTKAVPVSGLEKSLFSLADEGKWSEVAPTPLEPWLGYILEMQNALGVGETNLPPVYTLNKDLYDVTLLSRLIEGTPGVFNRAYYEKAKQEVNSISTKL